MALSHEEFKKYRVTKRPYPKDIERLFNVKAAMAKFKIKTVSELALKLKMNQGVLSEIINGTRLSKKAEERTAAFFGMEREELFPVRSEFELAEMNKMEHEGYENTGELSSLIKFLERFVKETKDMRIFQRGHERLRSIESLEKVLNAERCIDSLIKEYEFIKSGQQNLF